MRHCTVCGADAREGAKFCTSCGARLVDSVAAAFDPGDTATVDAVEPAPEPNGVDVSAEPGDDQPDPESAWSLAMADSAASEAESVPAEPAVPENLATEASASPEYTASWPTAEDKEAEETGGDVAGDEPPAQPGDAWSSWQRVDASTAPDPAPASFAADAEPEPEPRSWWEDASNSSDRGAPSSFAADADPELESSAAPDPAAGEGDAAAGEDIAEVDTGIEASPHGASEWESWAPVAAGEATVPASTGDTAASVRRLLDDLATRIDRLIAPAAIGARGVDADELADQLERWSHASQGSAGLLEIVQSVRKSPRDLDAIARLADRAPDLELLVRHYEAITRGAGDWSRRLREPSASDDAR